MSKANLFYAQSGGVTSVINASACGVIETARKHKDKIGKVYAGLNGIKGALSEELIDTNKESAKAIASLRSTPAGAFGSCRYKLKSYSENKREYERLMEVFVAHNIRYFLYNGGGDSQDTANKISQLSLEKGYPITCIGVPKTHGCREIVCGVCGPIDVKKRNCTAKPDISCALIPVQRTCVLLHCVLPCADSSKAVTAATSCASAGCSQVWLFHLRSVNASPSAGDSPNANASASASGSPNASASANANASASHNVTATIQHKCNKDGKLKLHMAPGARRDARSA